MCPECALAPLPTAGRRHAAVRWHSPRCSREGSVILPPRRPAVRMSLSSTSTRTFVIWPVVVGVEQTLSRRRVRGTGLPLMAVGYAAYRLAGAYRLPRAGGPPGMSQGMPEQLVEDGPYRWTRSEHSARRSSRHRLRQAVSSGKCLACRRSSLGPLGPIEDRRRARARFWLPLMPITASKSLRVAIGIHR